MEVFPIISICLAEGYVFSDAAGDVDLTLAMVESRQSGLSRIRLRINIAGGVGDTTTLITAPW